MSGNDDEILTSRSTSYMCGVIDYGHLIDWPNSGDIFSGSWIGLRIASCELVVVYNHDEHRCH